MKRRVTKKTEQELLASSNRALFDLLNLHNGEIDGLEARIRQLEQQRNEAREEAHQLRVSMHETHRSKSFRAGYFLLHPVGSVRSRVMSTARKTKRRKKP